MKRKGCIYSEEQRNLGKGHRATDGRGSSYHFVKGGRTCDVAGWPKYTSTTNATVSAPPTTAKKTVIVVDLSEREKQIVKRLDSSER